MLTPHPSLLLLLQAFMLLIVVPFAVEPVRKRVPFQTRKFLHLLAWPLLVALCIHYVRLARLCRSVHKKRTELKRVSPFKYPPCSIKALSLSSFPCSFLLVVYSLDCVYSYHFR